VKPPSSSVTSTQVPDDFSPDKEQKQSPEQPAISTSPASQGGTRSAAQHARCPAAPQSVARTQVPDATPALLHWQLPSQNGISKSVNPDCGRHDGMCSCGQQARSFSFPHGVTSMQVPELCEPRPLLHQQLPEQAATSVWPGRHAKPVSPTQHARWPGPPHADTASHRPVVGTPDGHSHKSPGYGQPGTSVEPGRQAYVVSSQQHARSPGLPHGDAARAGHADPSTTATHATTPIERAMTASGSTRRSPSSQCEQCSHHARGTAAMQAGVL